MTKNSPNFRSIVGFVVPFIFILGLTYFFQTSFLSNKEQLEPWLRSFGPLLVLIYVIIQSLAVIIPPISGFVFFVVAVGIFGPKIGFILSYLVTTPCFLINFLLARKYGRNFVIKMVGEKVMNRFDHYVSDAGVGTAVILKIFLNGSFDYISYIFGLTKMSFKTFALINIFLGIPATYLTYFVFTRFDNFISAVFAFQIFGIIMAFAVVVITHLQEKWKSKKENF